MPRLLLISPTDYASAVAKGVASLLAEFDEGGFFERVLIAFPFARTSTSAQVSDRVFVEDLGTDWLPGGGRSRWQRRAAAPLHVTRVIQRLVDYVRREHVDVIRATDPCFSGPIAWAVARLTGRPYCVSIHADFEKRFALGGSSTGTAILGSRGLSRPIESFVLRRAALVMPIRESLREYAVRAGARPGRVRVIPHGTDLTAFVEPTAIDIRTRLGLPPGTHVVSFAGRLVLENYVDDVLAVARRVGAVRDDVTFVLMGSGPEEDRLRAEIARDEVLRRTVVLAGSCPRDMVAAVRQASAVSLCLMGGFSLIEACAAGSAVVAYDVEWHAELVRDGDTGFLVREHDVEHVGDVVARLLDDVALGRTFGARGRALALAHHDVAVTAAVKRDCYRTMLAASPVAALSS